MWRKEYLNTAFTAKAPPITTFEGRRRAQRKKSDRINRKKLVPEGLNRGSEKYKIMLTNKNNLTNMGGTRSSLGAASCPATIRRGKGVFLFIGQIIAQVSFAGDGKRRSPSEPRVHFGFFYSNKYSKIARRQTMSDDRMWQKPQTPGEAVDTLEKLTDVIQFIADLTAQPTLPINEYTFSQDGYSGLFFFLCFIQDTIHDCQVAISKKPINPKGGV